MNRATDLLQQKIIPVYSDVETVNNRMVLKACYNAGLRHFEFTKRHESALDEFYELKKYCDAELNGMILGAGTIKNTKDAEMFIAAGAEFLVSPLVSNELIEFTRKKNIIWVPGCATASEVGMAESAGISLVKIFPAKQLGGAGFIKALKGPFPTMQFMATGGIDGNTEELIKYFGAGVNAVGLGSSFFTGQMNPEIITQKLKNLIASL